MTDTKDERIKRLERAAREWHAAWIAEPALEVIRELQAELRLRDDVPEGHGWLPQAEWQRLLDVQKGRVEAAERRADALERASRQAKARLERGWAEAAMRELEAALAQQEPDQPFASHVATDLSHNAACVSHDGADQPAQDGGRDAGCRAEPGDGEVLLKIDGLPTISICADDVEGFGYDLNEAADGTKPQTGVTVRLQPDQPADAGEPSCCARTRAEERERCAAAIRTNRRTVSGHRETWINAGLEEAENSIRRTNGDTP
jgi:hypothetical protein